MTTPRRRGRAGAIASATRILRAAAQLFRDRGFADTGMRDIADAADLSPANLYHYFDGKHDLLFYCQDRALDRMLAAVAAARRGTAAASERLRLVLTAHVQTLLDDVEGATAHLQIESPPPALRAPSSRSAIATNTRSAGSSRTAFGPASWSTWPRRS